MDGQPASIDMDAVVTCYTAIKDARTARRRAWEAADLELEADQQRLKVFMLDILNRTGAKSLSTVHGTVYRTEKVKPSAADWAAVYAWIAEKPERFELLEKRLKSTFVKEYMDDHDGVLPPGVNVHREFEVAVRRTGTATTQEENDSHE